MVARYLDCGIFERGLARIRCPDCAAEYLLTFSLRGRGLCPSCGAKRTAELAASLRDEVVADIGHAQWVFTVPKLLRPYFMHNRELLGPLCAAAWQAVRELMAVAAGEEEAFRPGMVAVVQTFGDQLNLHPHVHALVTRGGWTADGAYSNAVRGKLKARLQARKAEPPASGPASEPPLPLAPVSPSLAALRRGWARLIRRVYEVDPLLRPRCLGVMRAVAFITEPRVIRRILDHLAASAPTPSQGRAPPPVVLPAPMLP